jgi:hypothetical protein
MTFRNRLRTGIALAAMTAALGIGTLAVTSTVSVSAAGAPANSHVVRPDGPCLPWLEWCNKN